MEITRRETVYEGKYLRMVNKTAVTVEQQECIWETIERTNIYDNMVVVVVALTSDNKFVMERQWRAAVESYVIQFPAGLMDVENESSEETARRELLEETGYMTRVVFLMDKIMRRFGMSGKSVVPLISGTACAIPAVMAARNISGWKERLITILVVPFRRMAKDLGTHMDESAPDEPSPHEETLRRVGWAVRAVGPRLPWDCKCLVQAMAAQRMLRRRGIRSTLYLGVARDDERALEAHAWLRSGNIILTGRRGHQRYAVVSSFAD